MRRSKPWLTAPLWLLSMLLMLLLAGCAPAPTEPPAEVGSAVEQFFAMDTLMSINVPGAGEAGTTAAAAARAELERLDALLSRTTADSQLSLLNTHAGDGADVELDAELIELLYRARSFGLELGDWFDVTVAPLMDAWGFTASLQQVPPPEQITQLLPLVGSEALLVDVEAGTVRLEQPGMAVDLGAVAKGYAAGQAQTVLVDYGVQSALLDLGGNITAVGAKPDGQPWQVAVRDPLDGSQFLGVLALADLTASTSGGYERFFEQDGVRYHHILDPTSGWPAESGLLSVTVVSADPVLADALSTALFVAGEQQALAYWQQQDGFELVLCTEDKRVLVTAGLADSFRFSAEERGYSYETVGR